MNRQSGIVAMELTGATTDEVFKELDIVVDLDSYTLPGMDLTPDTTDQPSKIRRFTRGGEEDPHIEVLPTGEIIDFRYVDAAMESPERKYLKPKTRAGNDYTTDGDHSVTDTDEDVDPVHWGCEFEFDPAFLTLLWAKAVNLKGVKPKLTFSSDKTIHLTAHKEEWKSQKKSEEWNLKKVKTIREKEKQITTYHELGHALLAHLQPEADPVEKISIVRRGRALGVTWTTPQEDRYNYSKQYLLEEISVLLA
jgi:hypothetical protein